MEYGLYRALEAQVVSGSGVGENLTGILNSLVIVSVVFATDKLTTARKAKTSLESTGFIPSTFVLNPTDAEEFVLIREGAGSGQFLLGGPGGGYSDTLWAFPRIASLAVPAGTAPLADWSQAEPIIREDATLAVDRGGSLFETNQVRFHVEGRFGLAVKRPSAFAVVNLIA